MPKRGTKKMIEIGPTKLFFGGATVVRTLLVLSLAIILAIPLSASSFANELESEVFSSFKNYINIDKKGRYFLSPDLAKKFKWGQATEEGNFDISMKPLLISFSPSKTLEIIFDPGPSFDPVFSLRINGNDPYQIDGEQLFVSASGNFYVKTVAGDFFERSSKFVLANNQIKKVVQPYYLIDTKCKISTKVGFYSQPCNKGENIASVPKGATVRVLLIPDEQENCENGDQELKNFLVSTPFGLIGWVTSEVGLGAGTEGNPLTCMFYRDD